MPDFMFKPRQFLGPPRVAAPLKQGKVSAAVQFIIPGLDIASSERPRLLKLVEHVGLDSQAAAIDRVTNAATKQAGTLVSVAFYVEENTTAEATDAAVDNAAALVVERFMGLLSFLAGMRLVAVNAQTTTSREGGAFATKLEPSSRAGGDKVPFALPEDPFGHRRLSTNMFTALFWLRRGLAERDSLDTYSALMVSLQAIARELVGPKPVERHCPNCGLSTQGEGSVSTMVRELVVNRLGAPPELFSSIWRARNAVVAHGNESVTSETFLRLTELKFDATTLCYKGIKLALGLPLEGPPQPDPSFFVTSALMYVQ